MSSGADLLFRAIRVIDDEEFFDQPERGPSMAWTVGHLACVQDFFVAKVTGAQRGIPEEVNEIFKGGRRLLADESRSYPTRMELEAMFRASHEAAMKALADFSEDLWDRNLAPEDTKEVGMERFPTYGSIWETLATHTHRHLGQLSITVPKLSCGSIVAAPNLSLPN